MVHQELHNCLLASGTTDSGYLNRMIRLDNRLLKHSLRLISDSLWWLINPSIQSVLITILPLKHSKSFSRSTDGKRVQPGNCSGTSLSSTFENRYYYPCQEAESALPISRSPRSALSRFQVSARIPRTPVRSPFHYSSGVLHIEEVLARRRGPRFFGMKLLGSDWSVTYRSATFCVGTMGKSCKLGDDHDCTMYVRWL